MILHSIISPHDIFYNSEQACKKAVYRRINGGIVELDGKNVRRLISTDPRMYLDRRYCPYAEFRDEKK